MLKQTKKSFFAGFLIAIMVCGLAIAVGMHVAKASSKTITVPDDYKTIQMAIDSASPGDTVYVRSGIYVERIVVDKPVFLIGENKQTTVIDGSGTGTIVQITNSNVEVANFTIRNAGIFPWYGHGFPDSGFDVEKSNYITIKNNIVANATVGIWSYSSSNVTSLSNFVSNTTTMGIIDYNCLNSKVNSNFLNNCGLVGIHFDGNSAKCEISNNNVTDCGEGIEIEKSSGNTVKENNIMDNHEGLVFSSSDENSIEYCSIVNNSIGIDFYQSNTGNTFSHNSLINNALQVAFESNSPSQSPSGIGSMNLWDNGNEGNYWSDYQTKYPNASEVDSSGIGNTPYFIDSNNTDYHPLLRQVAVPEFPSWIILSAFITGTILCAALCRKRMKLKQLFLGCN
jgi:parallel beta-helix repeat protein